MAEVEKIEQASEKLKSFSPERLEAALRLINRWHDFDSAPPVTAPIAESVVNDWLLEILPDRFVAAEAKGIAAGDIWCVPVVLSYPEIGEIGQVGEVVVNAFSGEIISATPPDVMRSQGQKLYEVRSHEVEAAFL